MKDIASATRDVTGASLVTYDPDPPPPDQALPAVGGALAAEVVLGRPAPPREPGRPPELAPAPDGAADPKLQQEAREGEDVGSLGGPARHSRGLDHSRKLLRRGARKALYSICESQVRSRFRARIPAVVTTLDHVPTVRQSQNLTHWSVLSGR